MQENGSTFDKLVKSISAEEAQDLLQHIAETLHSKNASDLGTMVEKIKEFDTDSSEKRFAKESLFFRLWVSLRSFFSSQPSEHVYEEYLFRRLSRSVQSHYKNYVNLSKEEFTRSMYDALFSLRRTQVFFESLLSGYETDKGSFYLFLSSFTMTMAYNDLLVHSDPFLYETQMGISDTSRTSFLKKLDSLFLALSETDKRQTYVCAQGIEWMRRFCDLPLDKFLLKFTIISQTEAVCTLASSKDELQALACVFDDIRSIPEMVLETLFFLNVEGDLLNAEQTHAQLQTFLDDAINALSTIKRFAQTVPLIDFVRLATKNLHWQAQPASGGEDWFVLFKNAWKKRFNDKWNLWTIEQKRNTIHSRMLSLLKKNELQYLHTRPWEGFWIALTFKKELSFTFLKDFLKEVYPQRILPPLKVILLNGNFYRRESLAEYTACFENIELLRARVRTIESKLSEHGELGMAFMHQRAEGAGTLKGKENLETLMRVLDSEVSSIIEMAIEVFQRTDGLLSGIVGTGKSATASLLNWNSIQGNLNAQFKEQTMSAKNLIYAVANLLLESLSLEKDSL